MIGSLNREVCALEDLENEKGAFCMFLEPRCPNVGNDDEDGRKLRLWEEVIVEGTWRGGWTRGRSLERGKRCDEVRLQSGHQTQPSPAAERGQP